MEPWRLLDALRTVGWRPGGFVVEVGSQPTEGPGSSTALAALAEALGVAFVTVDPAEAVHAAAQRVVGASAFRAEGADFLRRFRDHISVLCLNGAALPADGDDEAAARAQATRAMLAALDAVRHALPRLTEIAVVSLDHTARAGATCRGPGACALPLLAANGFRILHESDRGLILGRSIHVAFPAA